MLETPEAVFEALRENNARPYGLNRTVTAEELAEAAGQFEEPDALVTALLELMEAYEYTGENRKSPVVFARLLKLWDDKPGAFSEWEATQLFWRFKWVTTSLLEVPDVPLAAIQRWTGQMAERYREAGHGMQPVAAMRHHVAAHTGTGQAAAYDLWVTRPRDGMSDCEACETRHRALHHLRTGEPGSPEADRRALDIWAPVLGGGQSCSEEPYVSQAQALLPLLRLGRTDEARSHHLVGYRFARGKTGMAQEVGLHIEFCALSRNEGRGLEILAENRALFGTSGSTGSGATASGSAGAPLALLHFLTGVQVLLNRLVEDGYATVAVAGPLGRSWTAETLLAHVAGEADALAAAFDARNGTTTVGDRRRARLAQAPVLAEPLPLGLRTASAVASAVPAPAPQDTRTQDIPEDFAALVTRARQMATDGHPGDTPLWTRIGERVAEADHVHDPELGPEDRLLAELARERAFALYEDEHWTDARAAMAEAARLFEQAGRPWDVLVARARIASVTDQATAPDPGAWAELDALLHEAEELLARDDSPESRRRYLTVHQCRAFAARAEAVAALPEIPPPVRERFESLTAATLSEAERLDVPQQAATARTYVADVAARGGRFDEAEAELGIVLGIFEKEDTPWRAPRAEVLLGQVLLQQARHAEAMEVLRRGMAHAARFGDDRFPVARTHALLGHACAHSGDPAGAVRHLSEAAARFDREGDDNAAAEIRLELADVLAGSGQQVDSVAVLESLVAGQDAPAGTGTPAGVDAPAGVDDRILAQARLSLARGLRELDEHRASAEQFLLLADAVADWDEQVIHTLAAAEAAVALARTDRWDAARSAYDRAVASHDRGPNPGPVGEMMRQFAALTMASEGPDGLDAALGHLSDADALLAAVPSDLDGFAHWYEAGSIHYQRGRALASAERFPEALAEMERAIAVHDSGGPEGESPRAEAVRVAALIEANGLEAPDAAIARITAAITRCEAAGLAHAAKILASLRENLRDKQ